MWHLTKESLDVHSCDSLLFIRDQSCSKLVLHVFSLLIVFSTTFASVSVSIVELFQRAESRRRGLLHCCGSLLLVEDFRGRALWRCSYFFINFLLGLEVQGPEEEWFLSTFPQSELRSALQGLPFPLLYHQFGMP